MKVEPGIARSSPSPWLLGVIAFVLLGLVAGLMQWAQTRETTRGIVGTPGALTDPGPIRSIAELTAAARARLLDARDVILSDVVVRETLGERVFLIGHDWEIPVVVFGELAVRHSLESGQHVRIYGMTRRLRSVAEVGDVEALEPSETARLQRSSHYLIALRVVPLPVAPRTAIPRVITSLDQLAGIDDHDALIARDVVLDRVRVVRVLGDHVFLVGDGRTRLPVMLFGELTQRQPESAVEIEVGDEVRIYGVLRRLRSLGELEDPARLSADEIAALSRHEVYLSGMRVVELEPSS